MGSEGFETKKIFVGGIPRTVNEGFLLISFKLCVRFGFLLLKLIHILPDNKVVMHTCR